MPDASDSLQTPQSPDECPLPEGQLAGQCPSHKALAQNCPSRSHHGPQLSGVAGRACPPPVSRGPGAVTHVAPSTPAPHVSTSNLSARGDQGPRRWAGQVLGDSEDLRCWEQKRQSRDLPKGVGLPRARPRAMWAPDSETAKVTRVCTDTSVRHTPSLRSTRRLRASKTLPTERLLITEGRRAASLRRSRRVPPDRAAEVHVSGDGTL